MLVTMVIIQVFYFDNTVINYPKQFVSEKRFRKMPLVRRHAL